MIETTGLANPAPIIQTFFLEPTLAEQLRLDGVVTLVRGGSGTRGAGALAAVVLGSGRVDGQGAEPGAHQPG